MLLSENGHRSYQYRLAIEINSKSLKTVRLVHTYKWLCLSALFGETVAKEIAQFIYLGMTSDEIYLDDKLVEEWIEEKFDSEDFKDKTGWPKELREFLENQVKNRLSSHQKVEKMGFKTSLSIKKTHLDSH